MLRRRGSGQTTSGLVLSGTTQPPPAPPVPGDFDAPGDDVGPAVQVPSIVDPSKLAADPRRIGEILVERGLCAQEQVDEAVEKQRMAPGVRIGQLLLGSGMLNERELSKTLAAQAGLPFVDLRQRTPSPEALHALDEGAARQMQALPLGDQDGLLVVAIGDPTVPDIFERLAEEIERTLLLAVASPEDLQRVIDRSYRATGDLDQYVQAFEARAASQTASGPAVSGGDIDENSPIVQVVSRILSQAVRDRASDVHIEPMGNRVRIRNRIDGALHEVLSLPQSMSQALVSRIKILAGMNIVERRRPQDGQLEFSVDGKDLDVRVSTTSTIFGEKTVLRVLDKQRALYDLAELGMPSDTGAVYADIIRSPWGMVVCAGPTGSGKTTTLYASLSAINNDEINVMTVEDPVEYVFPTINQIPINEQAGLTFASGLRSILRQDPDAVLVGEIRDTETARIAIQAALTGHFVLSTIHANDAVSALHRFLDMGIESFLLASSMLAVVGQRLLRQSCTECLEPYEPTSEDLAFYERMGGKPKDIFMHGAGCTFCAETGYLGRTGVYEVLKVTDEMRDLIVRNASVDDIRKLAIEQGMVPLRDQAVRLVAEDVTTVAEVLRTIYIL